MDGEALFQSAHAALLFACNYASSPLTAMAERTIASFARDRYPPLPSSGRGMFGLDGAAQAGMILACVGRLDTRTQLVTAARYTRTDAAKQLAACHALAIRARMEIEHGGLQGQPLHVIARLLSRHFGARMNLGRLADEREVDLRTVRRWQAAVRKWARPLEHRAREVVEIALELEGILVTDLFGMSEKPCETACYP